MPDPVRAMFGHTNWKFQKARCLHQCDAFRNHLLRAGNTGRELRLHINN